MEMMIQNTWKYASWGNDSIKSLRQESIALFERMGLPEVKMELYKYSNIQRLFNTHGYSDMSANAQSYQLSQLPFDVAGTFVLLNGKLLSADSIQGLEIKSDFTHLTEVELSELFKNHENDPMKALTLASSDEGIVIEIAANTVIEKPIAVYLVNDGSKGTLTSQIHAIKAGANSKVEFVINQVNANSKADFSLIAWQCFVAENASVQIFDTQCKEENHSGVFFYNALQQKASIWGFTQTALHGTFNRTNIYVDQAGEAAHTQLNGVFMPSENQHFDIHSFIGHNSPHGTSDELYKGIAGDNGKGFFNGKVYVARDAQKINAYQSNKNVLLSRDSTINSKPELEIYADDVKCSHGSTTGQLDETAIFYMQARGIRKEEAHKLLLQAFSADVFDRIENEEIGDWLKQSLKHIS